MSIMGIVSIAVGAILFIGFLFGFLRSWRRSTLRLGFLVACFIGAIFLTSTISKILMDNFVHGLVISAFGFSVDIGEMVGEMAGDLLADGSTITSFATALINIIINLVGFLLVFIALCLVTFIIYAIVAAIMSSKRKKKAGGKVKAKGWERLIGGGVGIIGAMVVCLALFTPVFGVMNVCDKFLETPSDTTASAYSETSLVCGKFYTEDSNIGTVETYLQKYDELRTEYNKSFAGMFFKYTGADALGKATFTKLSTVKQNNLTVNLTDEIVNVVNVYNVYKENFVETQFDFTTAKGVDAIEKMYNIAKKSEVLKGIVMDVVPKMAEKWSNGETFMGMELPLEGDTKDLVVDILGAFNTDEFTVLDENMGAIFEVIRVANNNDIIKAINDGEDIMNVIDEDDGTFIKDTILALSKSSQFKKVLPNVMNTMMKMAYKTAIDDPESEDFLTELGDETYEEKLARKTNYISTFSKEYTQAEIAAIDWNNEATQMQTAVKKLLSLANDSNLDLTESLGEFGYVIDASRSSVVLRAPMKTLMTDYINLKVDEDLGDAKTTVLNSINDNWSVSTFRYVDLFKTVQQTAKIAKDAESMDLTDMTKTITELIANDENGAVRDTIKEAIRPEDTSKEGLLETMLGDTNADKIEVFEDILLKVVEETTADSVSADLAAGQVIVDIISATTPTTVESLLDRSADASKSVEEQADELIATLVASENIMNVIDAEAEKGADSPIKSYSDKIKSDDKADLLAAINKLSDDDDKTTLKSLFGIS